MRTRQANRPRSRARLFATALILFAMTGCGGDRESTESRAEAPETPKQESIEPRRGGVLRIPLVGLETLDPARSTNRSEGFALQQIYQGLVRLDDRLRAVPDLARRWRLSEDRLTYRFELDPAARFHDDRPVTSNDVVVTLRRLLDPAIGSVVQPYLEEVLEGPTAISAPTPHTCEVRLRKPDHVFIQFLAMQHAKITPADSDPDAEPIGSGPFRVTERNPRLLRLEAVRRPDAPGPRLDGITIRSLDPIAEARAISAGELDYAIVAPSEVSAIEGFRATRIPTLELHFLGLRTDRPPFDDARVRRAVAFAIDRDGLESATAERIAAAKGVIPPGMPAHDPRYEPYSHDPAKARTLLRQAGFGPGGNEFPTVELLVGRMPERETLTARLVADLGAVGIPVRLSLVDDYGAFFGRLGKTELAILGWGADYPDPNDFFYSLFRTGAPYNFMGYSNPELDEAIENGRRGALSKVERALTYQHAERQLLEDCPAIPLFQDAASHCVRSTVRELPINAMGIYTSRLDRTWIAKDPSDARTPELTNRSYEAIHPE